MKLGKYETNQIYLADCYQAIKELPDNCIDCIYTDIPYLYSQGGGGNSELGQRTAKKRLELMGLKETLYDKSLSGSDLMKLANKEKHTADVVSIEEGIDLSVLNEFCRVMKKINIFIWCSKLQIADILNYFIAKGCNYEILVWCKTNPTPATNNVWLPDLEYCLYFRECGILLNDGYEFKSKYYISPANKKDKDRFNHPTIKPLELVERHLKHATQENDIVVDFFLGSGTTAVACKNTNRQYLGFEIQANWYKIAKDRLNNCDASGQFSIFTI